MPQNTLISTGFSYDPLEGRGAVRALLRERDWSAFPAGAPPLWPVPLKTIASLIFDSSLPMYVAWGPELNLIYNDAYAEILGSKHPASLARPFWEVWPEVTSEVGPVIAAALAGEPVFAEDVAMVLHRHGRPEPTWFTFSITPARDEHGLVAGVFTTCTETTSQVQASRRQRADGDWLQGLFNQAPGFMAILRGPDHVFEMGNAAYRALIGHREFIGRPAAEVLPEAVPQGFIALLDGVLQTGEPFVGSARRLVLANDPGGPLRDAYLDFVYQPILDDAGKPAGIFVQGYEVTAQQVAQIELQRLNEALAEKVRSLEQAEEKLRQNDRRKDDFLAMLAHELRNPLAPIGAAADLLSMKRLDETYVRRSSEIITRQVSHMTSLVDDLLDVSRVTRGLVSIDKVALDIKRVVADAVEQIRPMAEARRHRLNVLQPAQQAFVSGDHKRLVQVMTNLLGNAAKYTPDAGELTLRMDVFDEAVELSVADNGIGMSEELLGRAFDLFSQAERTPDRSQGGLGIGLALVRNLVELHGGAVTASSPGEGHGSLFTVRLPRLHQAARRSSDGGGAAAGTDSGARGARRRGLDVMVVDDNADAGEMLALCLAAAGHAVTTQTSSRQALALTMTGRLTPDVCILDIGLPDMDGNSLARQLLRLPALNATILIAVTGYGQAQDREASLDAGFHHYLVKPVDTRQLTALLDDVARARGGDFAHGD